MTPSSFKMYPSQFVLCKGKQKVEHVGYLFSMYGGLIFFFFKVDHAKKNFYFWTLYFVQEYISIQKKKMHLLEAHIRIMLKGVESTYHILCYQLMNLI